MRIAAILFIMLLVKKSDSQPLQLGYETMIATKTEQGSLKCEPSCIMTDKVIVVTWNDSYGGFVKNSETGTSIAWAISYDAGKSFQFGGYFKNNENKYSGADSWLAKDAKGNIYLSFVSWQKKNYAIYLYKMNNAQPGNWKLINIPVSTSEKDSNKVVIDKPSLYIAPDNTIYISYLRKKSMNFIMQTVVSTNGGKTFSVPLTISDTTAKTRLGNTIVKQGKSILCSWVEGDKSMRLNELWYSISFDNGRLFSKPALLSNNIAVNNFAPKGYNAGFGGGPFEMTEFPSAATSSSSFFILLNEPLTNRSSIKCFEYALNTRKWKPVVEIRNHSDSSLKMMPLIIDTRKGEIYTLYYCRNSIRDTLTDVCLTSISGNNYKLNTTSSNWLATSGDSENAPVQRNFGDYIFGCANKDFIFTVWTDGRHGTTEIYGRVLKIRK